MKKKILSLMLAMVMLLGTGASLSGCGRGTPDETGELDKYVELDWWTGYPLGIIPPETEVVMSAFNAKLKEKLNCKVNFHFVDWMGYANTMGLKINSGDRFDICLTGTMFNDYFANVRKEAFYDITEALPKYAPTILEKVKNPTDNPDPNTDSGYWDMVTVDGKIYGVVNRQIAARQYAAVLKKETFDAYTANAASPKTLDEMTELTDLNDYLAYAKSVTTTNQVTSGFDMTGIYYYWGMDNFGDWKMPGAVRYDDDTLTVINQFDTQEWRDTMTVGRDWYTKNYYWPNMATQIPNPTKMHMRFSPTYKPGFEAEEFMLSQYMTVEAKLGKPVVYTGAVFSAMNAISSTSLNPIRALQVLELVYKDKELYNMLVFGLEGQHYDVVEDLSNGLKRINMKNTDKYSMPVAFAFGDQFNQYIVGDQDEDIWEQTKEFDKNAEISKSFGFTFDSTPVKTYVATCSAIVNSDWYTLMVSLGKDQAYLDDAYAKFLDKLQKGGADKIIAEKQKQLDAWVAARGG